MRDRRAWGVALLVAIVLVACGTNSATTERATGDDAVTVASFDFPESVLLADIYAQAMESAGFRIERELGLGTRELVFPALAGGLVGFVPEYAGSALEFLAGPGASSADEDATYGALKDLLAARGITALNPSSAQDRNGFAVTSETAERYGLQTLSDLASVSPELTFGGPPECSVRPLCLPGLASRYGIHFGDLLELDPGGPLTVAALAEGVVDVALLFTSDGEIDRNGFVLLEDDRHLQPSENVTPIVRSDTLERFGPQLADVVNAVSAQLSTAELRGLNADVAQGRNPSEVASEWLSAVGLAPAVG